MTAVARRLPAASKRIGVGPPDEYGSSRAGLTPKAGVFRQKAAPTAVAPAALVWPHTVPLAVAYSWIVTPGLKWMYFTKPGESPSKRAIMILKSAVGPVLAKSTISTASPPRLLSVLPPTTSVPAAF